MKYDNPGEAVLAFIIAVMVLAGAVSLVYALSS